MYQTVRRHLAQGRGDILTKYPGKCRKPKTPHMWTYTTVAASGCGSCTCTSSLTDRYVSMEKLQPCLQCRIVSVIVHQHSAACRPGIALKMNEILSSVLNVRFTIREISSANLVLFKITVMLNFVRFMPLRKLYFNSGFQVK